MKLYNSILWMFFGSIFIGVFLNGMNILAYRFNDIYLSKTLIYIAFFMAFNMCILEIIMHGSHTGKINIKLIVVFIILATLTAILLRKQYFIDDNDWLKRMIGHHSTALTSSYKIKDKTKNNQIKKLANDIIESQENEIILMKDLLKK